jgi:hypothetical protein
MIESNDTRITMTPIWQPRKVLNKMENLELMMMMEDDQDPGALGRLPA